MAQVEPVAPATVLVVDDDPDARALARAALEQAGYGVVEAADGECARAHVISASPDLVVLDLGLPRCDGLDVLTEIRRRSDLPVILLTGRSAEADRVVGLRLGADDYLVKPFYPSELAARVDAVLRRSGRSRRRVDTDELSIDLRARTVHVDADEVGLTSREFDLLAFLASHPGRVFTRAELLESVWTSSSEWQTTATVTEHVRRIRGKLGPGARHLVTVHGAGYRFDP